MEKNGFVFQLATLCEINLRIRDMMPIRSDTFELPVTNKAVVVKIGPAIIVVIIRRHW